MKEKEYDILVRLWGEDHARLYRRMSDDLALYTYREREPSLLKRVFRWLKIKKEVYHES